MLLHVIKVQIHHPHTANEHIQSSELQEQSWTLLNFSSSCSWLRTSSGRWILISSVLSLEAPRQQRGSCLTGLQSGQELTSWGVVKKTEKMTLCETGSGRGWEDNCDWLGIQRGESWSRVRRKGKLGLQCREQKRAEAGTCKANGMG